MNPKKAKILLIEDDLPTVRMYEAKFRVSGLNLMIAETGQKGWQMVQDEKPDLVLLDVKLEDLSGFEVLKRIKAEKDIQKTPVFLLTNVREKGNKEKGLNLGAEVFVMKTKLLPDEVVAMVQKRLKKI